MRIGLINVLHIFNMGLFIHFTHYNYEIKPLSTKLFTSIVERIED
jgi:hypothetical protein